MGSRSDQPSKANVEFRNEQHSVADKEATESNHKSRLLGENGNSTDVIKSRSVNEIPLSPLRVNSLYEDSPAVVAIDSLDDDNDVITKDFGKNDKLVITDRSSAILTNMDNEAGDGSVVCGKNNWCIIS